MSKVLVVGFDGATWRIINPLVRQGKLPTFQKLMEKGAWGYMKSTLPPITIPAWISMFSGLKPDNLGIFDFVTFTWNNTIKSHLYSSQDTRGKLLWDILSKKELECLVLNMPGIYPPYPIKGHMMGLDFTPLETNTYPTELEHLLDKEYKLKEIRELQTLIHQGEKTALMITEQEEKKVLEILTSFSQKFLYDVIFVRFGIPDHVSHYSTNDKEMEKFHIMMDSMLKEILDSVPFEYILLVSDHGLQKNDKVFYVNKVLEDAGFLKTKLSNRILRFFISKVFEIGGANVIRTLYKRLMGFLKKRLDVQRRSSFVLEKLDDKTKAFAYAAAPSVFCPLYILDRFISEKIIETLHANKYIRDVHPVHCKGGPSAIVESFYPISSLTISESTLGTEHHWSHDLDGIFLMYGKGVKKGFQKDCSIYDVAPTLLHMLGLPIPEEMDGNVIFEIFEKESKIRRRALKYVDSTYYSVSDEKKKLKQSINELGKTGKI